MSWLRTFLISLSPRSPIERAARLSAKDTPGAARAIIRLARAHHKKRGYKPFADALKRMQHPALVDVFTEQVRLDDQRDFPFTTLNLLEEMKDTRFVPMLLMQLKERHASTVASLLADIGDRRAVAPLCDLLMDEAREPCDRSAAAEALGKLGDPSAVAPLVRLLKPEFEKVPKDSGANPVFRAIANAVGRIGDDDAIAAMAALLGGFGAAARAVDADTHFDHFCWHYDALAESLSYTRSRRATEALVSVLEVDARSLPGGTDRVRSVQGHAVSTLGYIADPVSLDWVLAAYQDRGLRHQAAAALAAFPDQRAQEIVAAHRKKKERCFLCGKDEVQAMLSPSPSAIRRAGGDAVVASMVSYIEAARSGKPTVKCWCGMWACRACLAERMSGIYESHECPGCNASFTRKQLGA